MEKHRPTLDPPQWGAPFNTDSLTDTQAACDNKESPGHTGNFNSFRKLLKQHMGVRPRGWRDKRKSLLKMKTFVLRPKTEI